MELVSLPPPIRNFLAVKLTSINDFKENTTVQGFFLCLKKNLRTTKVGDYYLDLLLQDASGRIQGKVWDNVDHYRDLFGSGDPIAVKGVVENYAGVLQLNCSHVALATRERYGRYGYREDLLILTIKEDPRKLWDVLKRLVRGLKDRDLKRLLKYILKTYKDTIIVLPGSVHHHHPERGGFLAHMVSVGKAADLLAGHYTDLDRDLLVAGALLHDIGKVRGAAQTLESGYTDEGQLVGHLVLGRDIIREAIAALDGFPADRALQLEHILLSHQGQTADGSPVPPKFPEALLVHAIDNMDTRLDIMAREIERDSGDRSFTDARNHFRTPLWKNHRR